MSVAVVLLTLVLLAVVIAVVSRPLLAIRTPKHTFGAEHPDEYERTGGATEHDAPRHEELQAAREAKYREIRDAELDYRTGKLSREDYEAVNGTLRAEAVEILDQLQALDGQDRTRDGQAGEEDRPTGGNGPAGSPTRVS